MDNDLIKALRCIASQDEDGNCKMVSYNLLRKGGEPYCRVIVFKIEDLK